MKLEANQVVRERHFLVRGVEKKLTKNGKEYYVLELSDSSGLIEAKVWDNARGNCDFEVGKIIEVEGKTQEYNGKLEMIMDGCRIINSEEAADYQARIPTLVFDIETVGKKFEDLDEDEQKYLLETLERDEPDKEKAKKKTGLYSIFGKVVAVGCLDAELKKGIVLAVANKEIKPEKENFEYRIFADETGLLTEFWRIAGKYEMFVTYNGDGFDFPYLMIRSAINRVKVSVEAKRYNDNFIDLMNKIRQNHSFKLEFLCRAMGITNPKVGGVHGDDVGELFEAEKYEEIANYVARDVVATSELYQIWKEYMKR